MTAARSAPAAVAPPVAVLGCAWRTPLGDAIAPVVDRIAGGARAAAPLTRFPAAGYPIDMVAEVAGQPARSRHQRFLRRMGCFGLEVAAEAVAAAGIGCGPRTGLYAGVGGLRAHWDDIMAALVGQRDDGAGAWAAGLGRIHPFWMLRHLSNNTHALIATELGARGDGATFGGGSGGAQALAAAARALAAGAVDAALVVAYDSLLEPETLVELGARRADDPGGRPAVPGEAAAALVVVRPADAGAAARVRAAALADGRRGSPAATTVERAVRAAGGTDAGAAFAQGAALAAALGDLGAATAPVHAIALAGLIAGDAVSAPATAAAMSAPGLAAAVHVEVP